MILLPSGDNIKQIKKLAVGRKIGCKFSWGKDYNLSSWTTGVMIWNKWDEVNNDAYSILQLIKNNSLRKC